MAVITESMWQCADAIARELVNRDCDPNEVHKAFVYLRTHNNVELFFHFLNTLVEHGRFLVRSRRTLDYYEAILETCQRHLHTYYSDPALMQQILGWSFRLMRFYMALQLLDVSTRQHTDQPKPRQREKRRD